MNGPFILVRQVLQWALILGIVGLANGCTPRMDWREIQLEPIAASALFPAKPVEVSRTLESAKDAASFMLTLRSARIDHTVFAVGWVLDANAEIRSVLESAMLANIGARPESIERKEIQQGDLLIYEVTATGHPLLDKFNQLLESNYGAFTVNSIDTVSPIIGPELFSSGVTSLIITILGIVIYISTRFTRDYAFSAIIALIHDVFIAMGLFAFLGLFFGIEVDSLFITALLTIFGFSVHDTIVVFDRIRENQKLQSKNFDFRAVTEHSIEQVFKRSLNTSITVLTVLAVLFFFGGTSTTLFSGALFFGLLIGTYSSLFIASPILVKFREKNS